MSEYDIDLESNRPLENTMSDALYIKCTECETILSVEEIKHNENLAKKRITQHNYMCYQCWSEYCYHAITGQ